MFVRDRKKKSELRTKGLYLNKLIAAFIVEMVMPVVEYCRSRVVVTTYPVYVPYMLHTSLWLYHTNKFSLNNSM